MSKGKSKGKVLVAQVSDARCVIFPTLDGYRWFLRDLAGGLPLQYALSGRPRQHFQDLRGYKPEDARQLLQELEEGIERAKTSS